jgi:hypothetical protein
MAAAIRERRILSITYVGALEPQLFAPVALYVSTANRLIVDGYELNGKRVRVRELDLDTVRDVVPTEQTYVDPDHSAAGFKKYPAGTAVLARAGVPALQGSIPKRKASAGL